MLLLQRVQLWDDVEEPNDQMVEVLDSIRSSSTLIARENGTEHQ